MFPTQGFSLQYASLPWLAENVDANLFAFAFPMERDDLVTSIAECGVIQPLLIRGPDQHNRAILLSGHRRLWALKTLQVTQSVPLLVIPAREISLAAALQLYLAENSTARSFNIVERARILYFCLRRLSLAKEEVVHHWMPRVGLKPSLALLSTHLKILQLPEPVLNYVLRENLNLKTAEHLAQFQGDALDILFPIITRFQVGVNRLEEILTHIETVAKREDRTHVETLEDLLTMPEVAHLLSSREGDTALRLEAFRQVVRRRAFPTLSDMEASFSKETRALNLPSSVSLKAPAYFEGDRLDVQFKFKSPQELKTIAQKLLDSADEPALSEMLNLL